MFLDKVGITLELAVEGAWSAWTGRDKYCFRVGHVSQPLVYDPCQYNVMKFGVQFQNQHVFET